MKEYKHSAVDRKYVARSRMLLEEGCPKIKEVNIIEQLLE
jgi:hypothetical protein